MLTLLIQVIRLTRNNFQYKELKSELFNIAYISFIIQETVYIFTNNSITLINLINYLLKGTITIVLNLFKIMKNNLVYVAKLLLDATKSWKGIIKIILSIVLLMLLPISSFICLNLGNILLSMKVNMTFTGELEKIYWFLMIFINSNIIQFIKLIWGKEYKFSEVISRMIFIGILSFTGILSYIYTNIIYLINMLLPLSVEEIFLWLGQLLMNNLPGQQPGGGLPGGPGGTGGAGGPNPGGPNIPVVPDSNTYHLEGRHISDDDATLLTNNYNTWDMAALWNVNQTIFQQTIPNNHPHILTTQVTYKNRWGGLFGHTLGINIQSIDHIPFKITSYDTITKSPANYYDNVTINIAFVEVYSKNTAPIHRLDIVENVIRKMAWHVRPNYSPNNYNIVLLSNRGNIIGCIASKGSSQIHYMSMAPNLGFSEQCRLFYIMLQGIEKSAKDRSFVTVPLYRMSPIIREVTNTFPYPNIHFTNGNRYPEANNSFIINQLAYHRLHQIFGR